MYSNYKDEQVRFYVCLMHSLSLYLVSYADRGWGGMGDASGPL